MTMTPARLALAAALMLFTAALVRAAPDPAGRWEGVAQIPGAPLRVVVDIAAGGRQGHVGSVILPGRGVKGAPLEGLTVDERGLRFGLGAAFGIPAEPAPAVQLVWRSDGTLAGELQQGGHAAALVLQRTGVAQVDLPLPRTAVSATLVGTWVGRYELGGYPRDVTLTLANGAQGLAAGELVIVGKRTSTLAIDHVVQGSEFVTLQASAAGLRIEGRWATADGTIQGQLVQGPFEAALVLRRRSP